MSFVRSTWSLVLLVFLVALHVTHTSARYHHIKLRHGRHRRQHGESYLPGSFVLDSEDPERGNWGPWSMPSSCSRSCGGGVAYQTRECRDVDHTGHERCTGARKRYFSCNVQKCEGEPKDFRAEQCAEYNNVPFEGVYYDWIPYTGAPKKCELNCMPRGERFFYRHKSTVIDGTPCDVEGNDVCVEGKCMPVGCDLMLGSDAKEDACRDCGGNGSDCNTVNGLFDTDKLQVGYNDILLIPQGATNIKIREIRPSNNYLAIRNTSGHYYLNGNWRIDFPRSMRFAGTIFHYSRDPQGFSAPDKITALGPTNEPIYVVLLYQDRNVGVDYEYSVPKKFSQPDTDIYSWITEDFAPCSATCGGGFQYRHVTCVRQRTNEPVDEKLCNPQTEPEDTQSCNEESCPPEWVESEWSPCSKHCGEGGEQTRDIKCEQVVSGGKRITVDESQCTETLGPKGTTKQECNRDVECPKWHVDPWKPCDHLCGEGKQTRRVACYRKNAEGKIEILDDSACVEEVPEREKPCELRPCEGLDWITSEWSGCIDKCGLTQETRTVQCATQSGSVYPDDKCDPEKKPPAERECQTAESCDYQWFTTQWSECSAACGTGVQTRQVFCATYESEESIKKVPESKCDPEKKYNDTKECTAKVEECKGEWFAGPWSKCSKPCGGGEMSRKVVCLKDNMTVSVDNCDIETIMFSKDECNKQPCEKDEIIPVEPTKEKALIDEESEEEECEEDEEGDIVIIKQSLITEDKISGITEASPLSSPFEVMSESTGSTWEDMMFSDAAYSRGDIEITKDYGSGTGSGFGSGDTDFTDITSGYTSELFSTFEGSGTSPEEESSSEFASVGSTVSGITESSTISGVTMLTTESGTTDQTTTFGSDITEESTMSGQTEDLTTLSVTQQTTDSSETVTDITETSVSDSSTISTDSASTESTEFTQTTSSSITESTDTAITEESSSTVESSTQSSDSSEMSESTETNVSTMTTGSSEETSTMTTDTETTETTTETPTSVSSETTASGTTEMSGSTESIETTTSGVTTESGETTESGATTESGQTTESAVTTESSQTTESGTTESGMTTESGETTESGATTESGQTTDSGMTTESGQTTESGMTTESGQTTESGATTESGETTESGATTESGQTTESGMTTESGETALVSEGTTESGATDLSTISGSTVSGEEEADLTARTHISELWTTPRAVQKALTQEHTLRVCKPKKKSCKKSTFGCCYDGITPAQGAFGKGCPTPRTCNETKYGCCPDKVSPALGPKNKGCPPTHCEETLFGCCQDGITPAEGNDFEGCKIPCNETEFGCCPDNETPASGKNNFGCCNTTQYGCCPDGIKPASGPDDEGCEEEVSVMPTTEQYEVTTIMEGDCANSTYGCCPDGVRSATGTNFEGCGVINTKNCSASYFGCCPDGITAALGQRYEGCHMSCENSTYGCCSDGITPAHGPNGEGCCLSTPFKCCPDNILPARGPDFYGCGCQYSRFGCCPDNETVARGPDNEGCGCQYTTYGCCPNRFTPASGPNFEGCPCYTYQFGCCPDGVTIAKGPHGQGCGCETTEFKCCSDGRTPAKGPNFAGCTCAESKYGCCEDGIEEAQGENFEGCRTVPTVPGAACSLEKDRGPCHDFTVNWFYDTVYGGCSRFWYGGCEGNDNRFKTQEECKEVCVEPKGKDACYLPKISGPCEGYYPTWYYDTERGQCGQFIYGGCLGNANKFKTREDCEELCVTSEDDDPCEQPKEEGPCKGNFTRRYFNKDSQACEVFRYGGCKGNNNNFPTDIACQQKCLKPGRSKEYCSLPRAEGDCKEKHPRWYFDQSENRCMPFYYSGCGGNRNNYDSREACDSDCPPKIEQDICLLPAILGECHNYTQRWYYDSYERRCRQFYYGGCGGNGNNFESEHDCMHRCESPENVTVPSQPSEFKTDFCFLPNERGPCTENQTKWFYDSRDGTCKQFSYGGCGGNDNNFNSHEECEYRCGEVQDACDLPRLVGPCNGTVVQYFYDKTSDACYSFEYSGCLGNKNRFEDLASCERKCRRRPVQPDGQHTTSRLGQTDVAQKGAMCDIPPDAGPCSNDVTAYYYDKKMGRCQAFIYGGCDGNANRFQTEEQCERLCGIFQGQDICNLPLDPGPCRAIFPKFYYDQRTRRCLEFHYGGCEGNANRFSSATECESVCIHHEEPGPTGNDTALSHLAICKEPVDIGSCTIGNYKRFYYDEEDQTCKTFIYTGCGGNRNNFKTFEACINSCFRTSNEIDVDSGKKSKDPCIEAREECNTIRCPYGKEAFVDNQDCERCRCVDPCRTQICPEGTTCAITLIATKDGTEHKGICRQTVKPGRCPAVSSSTRCEQECSTDADCSGDWKCCNNGCGTSCLEPASEVPQVTLRPVANVTAPQYGYVPASIQQPEKPDLRAEEGGMIVMKCIVIGVPIPTITWRKDTTLIEQYEKRRRILSDGSLQITNLYTYDNGIYVCTADNGQGPPARVEYHLEVTEPHKRPAAIAGEPEATITVNMNSPTVIRCYALGWPRPHVTWWRGNTMLPLLSENFEQDSDYALHIRVVHITNLGMYTCQAYNGIGRAASWSVVLQAIGPVYNIKPEHQEYAKYLLSPPKRPERPTSERPQYPYRPQRPENYTHAPPIRSTWPSRVPTVIPLQHSITERPRFKVPVKLNVSVPQTQFPEGSDINIDCSVSGYPSPRVTWFKDDQPINTDNRVRISEGNRLSINDANKNDSGEYRCEASNEISYASESVQIHVAGIFIHPNCQDNSFFAKCELIVMANYCRHKYYAKFCCRSCTEAGQLPASGPSLEETRRKRSILPLY